MALAFTGYYINPMLVRARCELLMRERGSAGHVATGSSSSSEGAAAISARAFRTPKGLHEIPQGDHLFL